MIKMVPPNIDAIVYDILKTCTIPDFQFYLKTRVTNALLLEKVENHYQTLSVSKKVRRRGPPRIIVSGAAALHSTKQSVSQTTACQHAVLAPNYTRQRPAS
jgi:hypothetical protein